MGIEELIDLMNSRRGMQLTPLKEKILRCAWKGFSYPDMANQLYYHETYLKKIASEIWQDISTLYGENISKSNFRFKINEEETLIVASDYQQLVNYQQLINYQQLVNYQVTVENDIFEFPGSPISLDNKFYIERFPVEDLAYYEIRKHGSVTCIHAPLKMGKSSLLIRILDQAKRAKYKTITIDLKTTDDVIFQDLDKFLRWFCVNVSRQLKLPHKLDEYWDDILGSKMNCTHYFQDYILPSIDQPIVLAFNEFNRIFNQNVIVYEFSSLSS